MMTASPSNQSNTKGLAPEIEVLLCCARIHTPPPIAEHVRSLLQKPFKWNYLIDLAKFHKVIPLLFQTLNRTCSDLVPKAALQQLQSLVYANTYQNLFLTQELLRILKLFEANGVHAIAFKGPTLAISAYGDLSLRQIGDLDLLLPKDAIKTAQTILIAEGYQLTGNYEWEFHFTRKDGYVHIDLHQEIAPRFYNLPFHFEKLWSRVNPIPIGGVTVHQLHPEDLLLLLSLVWFRDCTYLDSHLSLHLLSDVDAILNYNYTSLDWNWILNRANSQGCERILLLMLTTAHQLFGTILPEVIIERRQDSPVHIALTDFVKERLFVSLKQSQSIQENPGLWEFLWAFSHRFYLQARERPIDRTVYSLLWLRILLQASFIPNQADLNLLYLPKRLHFLYFIVHPVRLIFKHVLAPFLPRLQ
jgi:hypothetical protein